MPQRPRPTSISPRRTAYRPTLRVALPGCLLVLIVAPGCVGANPFFRVTATLWSVLFAAP